MRRYTSKNQHFFIIVFVVFLVALCINGAMYNYSMADGYTFASRSRYIGHEGTCLTDSHHEDNSDGSPNASVKFCKVLNVGEFLPFIKWLTVCWLTPSFSAIFCCEILCFAK